MSDHVELKKANAELSAALRKLLDAPQGSTKYIKVWAECNEVLNRCGSEVMPPDEPDV